jgi:ketosteroid isomerase-like protein
LQRTCREDDCAMPDADDDAKIRAWFTRLAEHVRAVDFAGARPIFAADMVAFGTFSDFVEGRDAVEAAQWRQVWPFITGFAWRLDGVRAIVASDRLSAVGMAVFESTGYREDGTPYERPGRATVAFGRARVGADWIARHTHMSLFRGVPDRSFGKRP